MTYEMIRLLVALGLFVSFVAALGWAVVERTLRVSMMAQYDRLLEREQDAWSSAFEKVGNMQTMGTPTVRPVEASRVIDPEERVARMISEETIMVGMESIANEYRAAGRAVPEPDALRSEVLSMIGGNEPTIETFIRPS